MTEQNGWKEYKKVILSRIDTLEENLKEEQQRSSKKFESIMTELTRLQVTLQLKGGFWVTVSGLLSASTVLLIYYLGGHLSK